MNALCELTCKIKLENVYVINFFVVVSRISINFRYQLREDKQIAVIVDVRKYIGNYIVEINQL